MNNNLCTVVYNNKIQCIVKSDNKKLFSKIPKTRMEQKTKVGKRTIIKELVPFTKLGDKYFVPRYMPLCLGFDGTMLYHPEVKKFVDTVKDKNIKFNCQMSDKRHKLLDRVISQLDNVDGASLQLNTGKGKTTIANYIINHYKKNSIIFTVNEELQTQADEDARDKFGDTVNIVLLGGKKTKIKLIEEAQKSDESMIEYLGDRLTIFICVYMSAKKLSSLFWKYIYLAIFDECHCYCNNTGVALMESCRAQKTLGMSATVEYDWRSKIAEYWCGSVVDGDVYIPNRQLDGKVTIINYKGNKIYTEERRNSTGTRSNALMVNLLAEDPERNQLIINNILDLLKEKYVIIVIASSNMLVEKLNTMLEKCCDAKAGLLIRPTSKEERKYVKHECDVIFTNYMFSRVGVNIPRATAMIFASPYKENGKQINGRILRSDEQILRKYIDIVDYNTYLKRWLNTRLVDYNNRGFELEYI